MSESTARRKITGLREGKRTDESVEESVKEGSSAGIFHGIVEICELNLRNNRRTKVSKVNGRRKVSLYVDGLVANVYLDYTSF